MSADVGTSSISFSGLRTAWSNASYAGGSDPGSSTISISEFHGATFTSGDPINADEAGDSVSINTHFKGRTFGSASSTFYLKITNDGDVMNFDTSFFVQIRGNSGDDVNSDEVHFGALDAVTLEIVDDSIPTSGITINFVSGDASGPNLTSITLSGGMHSDITYTAPGSGGATSITFASTGSSLSPLTMGISAQ
jgi:hypothetical protein